ncbi:MAG: hypothetical protein RL720_1109, partial [Actinomycetota bacterium]
RSTLEQEDPRPGGQIWFGVQPRMDI